MSEPEPAVEWQLFFNQIYKYRWRDISEYNNIMYPCNVLFSDGKGGYQFMSIVLPSPPEAAKFFYTMPPIIQTEEEAIKYLTTG